MFFTLLFVSHIITGIASLAYIAGSLSQADSSQRRVSLYALTLSILAGIILSLSAKTSARSVLLHAVIYLAPYALLFGLSVRKQRFRHNTLDFALPTLSMLGLVLLSFSSI